MKKIFLSLGLGLIYLNSVVAAVDIFQDMETGANGDTLNTANVSASSHGSGGTWSVVGTMWTSNLNDKTMRGPITVGGTSYSGSGSRTWRCVDNVDLQYVQFNTTNMKNALVVSGFLTIGPNSKTDDIYDAINVGIGSVWAVCQINTYSAAPKLWIEAPDPGTMHSPEIQVAGGVTYWVSFKVDAAAGLASLAVYDINTWNQIGLVTRGMNKGTIGQIRFGRADTHGNTSPTYTYFDDISISWTDTTFPYLPAAGGNPTPTPTPTPSPSTMFPGGRAPVNVWKVAGVPGGIPNRTTIYTTLNPGATAADIQTAVKNCPAGQVVQLSAGTYNISNISIGIKDDWVLRGAGMGKTILNITATGGAANSFAIGGSAPWDGAWTSTTSITGGGTQESTQITVADASAYNGGDMAIIEQDNTSWIYGVGSGGDDGGASSANVDSTGKSRHTDHVQAHIIRIMSKTGSTLTFSPPLPYSLESARNPELVRFSDKPTAGSTYRGPQRSGLEDMTLVFNGTSRGLVIVGTYAFWLKNIEAKNWGGLAAFWIRRSAHLEMRGCFIHEPNAYAVDHGYGVQLDPVSGSLITDNIIYHCQSNFLLQGACTGNVISYNAFVFGHYVNSGYTGEWLQHEMSGNHTPFPAYNLFEGNYTGKFQSDYYYGPSGWGMIFRNRIPGNSAETNQNRYTVSLDAFQRYYSVVGNQLGELTAPTTLTLSRIPITLTYRQPGNISWTYNPGSASFSAPYIYRLGYPFSGNNGAKTGYEVHDPQVKILGPNDTFLHGNWDAANNGVTWDTAVADQNIPNSLYLDSKPANFGGLTWPPYGPTAPTLTTGKSSITESDLAKIPAGYRLLYNADPPASGANPPHPADTNNDFLMSVNEATKYAACWKNPAVYADCPASIAIDYAVRAGTIWNATANGQYQYNSAVACPICWELKP